MTELEEYFDIYAIKARFGPALFTLAPVFITLLAWCPYCSSITGGIATFAVSFGIMSLLSITVSNAGQRLQTKLFKQWGGAPSTLLLRFADKTIDIYTKYRYHQVLSERIDGLNLPSENEEATDPISSDLKYNSAVNYLITHTQDKSRFSAVFRDNVNYGFARNLLALKPLGIAIALVSVLYSSYELNNLYEAHANSALAAPMNGLWVGRTSLLFSLTWLTIFVLMINPKFVRRRADRYAKSLLATCELHN